MDFTREPIIESVITPKEGSTLAVRSSKGTGQEEYFVDAVELVSFGNSLFFRSLERPKNFLLPVSDYEILEVRETRLVLKNVGLDRSIKIAGGREAALRTGSRLPSPDKGDLPVAIEVSSAASTQKADLVEASDVKAEEKPDKKRDRRRNYKRRRGRDEPQDEEIKQETEISAQSTAPLTAVSAVDGSAEADVPPVVFSSLLPPPSTLISETIARYKDNVLFRGAFFSKEKENGEGSEKPLEAANDVKEKPQLEEPKDVENIMLPTISLDLPEYTPPEMTVEEEERIYRERQSLRLGRKKNKPEDETSETHQTEDKEEEINKSVGETPEELEIPEELMMQKEAEGFADNMDVDLRQKNQGMQDQEPQFDEDFSEERKKSD